MLRTLIRHIRVFRSELFDLKMVREQVPACPRWRWSAIRRYLSSPELWRISTHPLFDGDYYLTRNPDVVDAGVDPLSHYLARGDKEERDPHPLFSVRHYRVDGGFAGNRVTALEDYLRRGAREGKTPCRGFDYSLYRECVGERIAQKQGLSHLARYPMDGKCLEFVDRAVQQALQTSERSKAIGSLSSVAAASVQFNTREASLCDVVIPVKNAVDWLDRSITFLLRSAHPKTVGTIVLVDDSCSDETRAFLTEILQRDPRIVLVHNESSPGFAAACNTGFRHTSANHVLFLNSDCLLNEDTIPKMLRAFTSSPRVGLACAASNNAANVTLPMLEGESFVSMNSLVEGLPQEWHGSRYIDICTTVGHCLMVSRECYQRVGGMDESWGLGYGEESDLHLRARAQGFLAVLVPDAYVYHFGGGTFRYEKTRAELQRKNHERFIGLWGDAFDLYSRLAEVISPTRKLTRQLASLSKAPGQRCDVLFVLPCLIRGIGGVHVTLDLCNHLITCGVDARVVVVGPIEKDALAEYPEPLYVSPYHAKDVEDFLTTLDVVPSVVVTTLFSTVPSAWRFAQRCGARLINFVQGFEAYFDGGKPYEQVRNTYFLADTSITTSSWLTEKVKSKAPGCDVRQLPLGINRYIFYPSNVQDYRGGARLRVGVVLRASVDKGQFILRELVDLLLQRESEFSLTVFKPGDYPLTSPDSEFSEFTLVPLPASRTTIADALREVDVFVDASLHEGYGLLPLEAMACGAGVVVSDSGGVNQYIQDGVNGRIVVAMNKPEAYLEQLLKLHKDREELARMRKAAVQTAQGYDEQVCFDGYYKFLSGLLDQAADKKQGDVSQSANAAGSLLALKTA